MERQRRSIEAFTRQPCNHPVQVVTPMTRIMDKGEDLVSRLARRVAQASQVALFLIAALILANIIKRIWWAPILGTYEMVEILGAVTFSLGAAYCSITRSHVVVGVVVDTLSRTKQLAIDIATNLVSALIIGFISWALIVEAGNKYHSGLTTTALNIPLWPVYYLVAFGLCFVALVVVLHLARSVLELAQGGNTE